MSGFQAWTFSWKMVTGKVTVHQSQVTGVTVQSSQDGWEDSLQAPTEIWVPDPLIADHKNSIPLGITYPATPPSPPNRLDSRLVPCIYDGPLVEARSSVLPDKLHPEQLPWVVEWQTHEFLRLMQVHSSLCSFCQSALLSSIVPSPWFPRTYASGSGLAPRLHVIFATSSIHLHKGILPQSLECGSL